MSLNQNTGFKYLKAFFSSRISFPLMYSAHKISIAAFSKHCWHEGVRNVAIMSSINLLNGMFKCDQNKIYNGVISATKATIKYGIKECCSIAINSKSHKDIWNKSAVKFSCAAIGNLAAATYKYGSSKEKVSANINNSLLSAMKTVLGDQIRKAASIGIEKEPEDMITNVVKNEFKFLPSNLAYTATLSFMDYLLPKYKSGDQEKNYMYDKLSYYDCLQSYPGEDIDNTCLNISSNPYCFFLNQDPHEELNHFPIIEHDY